MSHKHSWVTRLACVAVAMTLSGPVSKALAFPYIVKPADTLARISETLYGRVEFEQLLAVANRQGESPGTVLLPGMRLEIPALAHHRVSAGETWGLLAERYLGHEDRSDVLALANHSMPWLVPDEGAYISIPYNLRYVVEPGESTLSIAYRFLGERDKAWVVDKYNHRKGEPVRSGDVLLVPIVDLQLTPKGELAARTARDETATEGDGRLREIQLEVESVLPMLREASREGRFVEVVNRASELLGRGQVTTMQAAQIHWRLVESYVALGQTTLAKRACEDWHRTSGTSTLDPVMISPKIIRACTPS